MVWKIPDRGPDNKLAIQKIKQSEDKFNALFQLSPFGIILTDEAGNFTDANESFIKTIGYTLDEMAGIVGYDGWQRPGRLVASEAPAVAGRAMRAEVRAADMTGV